MHPTTRVPTHPGEILREEFLAPIEFSQVEFAAHIGVPVPHVNEIVRGRRGVSPESAGLLAQALGTTPEFWVNLKAADDLSLQKPTRAIKPLKKTG
jgi:addiction module HigA family antidote